MKKMIVFSVLAAVGTLASAQDRGRVLSSTPVVQQVGIPQQVCGNETVYSGNRTSGAGAVIGALVGGAAGKVSGRPSSLRRTWWRVPSIAAGWLKPFSLLGLLNSEAN